MGLDIYLKRYDDFKATREAEKEYEELTNKIWDENGAKYDDLSEEQKESFRIGIGRFNTEEEIRWATKKIIETANVKLD